MKSIFGLGNPGKEYDQTRHNVGFLVLDEIARQTSTTFTTKRSVEAELVEVQLDDQRVLLVKPQTFMNVSGRTFAGVCSKYPVTQQEVLVIYDDADLPFGDIRFKQAGGSAGHRGIESILAQVPKGTSVARLRVGIGRPPHPDIPLDQFVLGRWSSKEQEELPAVIQTAIDLISTWLTSSTS